MTKITTIQKIRTQIALEGLKQVEDIPKVPNAGEIIVENGSKYQIMFNGVKVPANAYYGEWITNLIQVCQGHHEPQEEYVFYHVLQKAPSGAHMMELGCYWGFYSTWFLTHVENAKAILVEPDPANLPIALATLNANQCTATIDLSVVGDNSKLFRNQKLGATSTPNYSIPLTQVDELMKRHQLDHLYILHSDIQGSELKMLQGAQQSLQQMKIDYIFISTHRSDELHQACIETLQSFGYRILAEHNRAESYSFDGLIVACSNDMHDFTAFQLHKRVADEYTQILTQPPKQPRFSFIRQGVHQLRRLYRRLRL